MRKIGDTFSFIYIQRMKNKYLFLALVFVLAFVIFSGGTAEAKQKKCPNLALVPASVKKFNNAYARKHGPTRKRGVSIGATKTKTILYYAWRSFGYSKKVSGKRAILNARQARIESGYRANQIQTALGINKKGSRAGGLFQFISPTFNDWKVRGYTNRFAPLDNSLAAVNAQINAKYLYTTGTVDNKGARKINILAGQGGWAPSGGSNPCR